MSELGVDQRGFDRTQLECGECEVTEEKHDAEQPKNFKIVHVDKGCRMTENALNCFHCQKPNTDMPYGIDCCSQRYCQ
jgi:hypothetical protein